MEAVKFNAELIFQQRAWRSWWNKKALWMVCMHLSIIQLPQGSTLSRLHGVGTTSQKGELEVAFLDFFCPLVGCVVGGLLKQRWPLKKLWQS